MMEEEYWLDGHQKSSISLDNGNLNKERLKDGDR
jgi:hypothetical protein